MAAQWLSVVAAIGAAASFGTCGVLQQYATRQVPQRAALRPGLLVDLARQPLWLGSLVLAGMGSGLQALALATGSVAMVQPLLVSGLLFAVLVGALLHRQRPDRIVLLSALLCMAGLATFLVVAAPTQTAGRLGLDDALPLACGLAVILGGCLIVASRYTGQTRALALAVGCGVLYGVTAGMAKLLLDWVAAFGLFSILTYWPLYVVAITGPLGFLLNQNAFQVGTALAPILAVIIILDPLISIGVGILWLGEELRSGPAEVFGQVIALIVLCVGVVLLAHRSPHVASQAPVTSVEVHPPRPRKLLPEHRPARGSVQGSEERRYGQPP